MNDKKDVKDQAKDEKIFHFVVKSPFSSYKKGDYISDLEEIKKVLQTNESQIVRVNPFVK